MPSHWRIGIAGICQPEWVAGCHYLTNLNQALKTLGCPPTLVDVALTTAKTTQLDLDERLVYQAAPRSLPHRAVGRIRRMLGQMPEPPFSAYLREHGIQALFANKTYGDAFRVPVLYWLPDLQHQHLPHFFTADERDQRDRRIRNAVREAARIVMSSEAALHDLVTFIPEAAAKARLLHFVAQPPAVDITTLPDVRALYHLPERYFYLPNQFWQHKNHRLVLQALQRAHRERPELTIVCTGLPYDYRAPNYVGELLAEIAVSGLYHHFMVLGMVPHAHVFALMWNALAIVQPSRFEGWSTTVEEAKSAGKAILMSDLPVHREQNPPLGMYFGVDDADALADQLVRAYDTLTPGIIDGQLATARADLVRRTQQFAAQFMAIAAEVINDLH